MVNCIMSCTIYLVSVDDDIQPIPYPTTECLKVL